MSATLNSTTLSGTTLNSAAPRTEPETTRTTRRRPAPATPLWRLSAVELRKMVDTRAGFWLLAVIGLLVVAAVVVRSVTGEPADRDLAAFFSVSLLPVNILMPVLAILAVTSEWSQRTALATFALVPKRGRVASAKLLAVVAITVASVAFCLAAAAGGNLIAGGGWDLSGAEIGYGVLFQLIGVLMGVAFGAVLMNSATAIVLYFVIPTAWTLLGSMVSALETPAKWLDLTVTSAPLLEDAMTAQSWARLSTSVALWVLLPLALGTVRLHRREVK